MEIEWMRKLWGKRKIEREMIGGKCKRNESR